MGAAMERLAAHIGCGLTGDAELEQYLAVECDFAHKMAAIVGQKHRVVGRHVHPVRPRILALAPRAQKIAGAVEHDHRVLAAVEDIDVVVAVDTDPADLLKGPAVGQFRPRGIGAVFESAISDDHRWPSSRDCSIHPCRLCCRVEPAKTNINEEPLCPTEETTGWR